jgi:hypothetical protein
VPLGELTLIGTDSVNLKRLPGRDGGVDIRPL